MNRTQRHRIPAVRFTPTQPTAPLPENYLLRFDDNGELIVAKKTSIKSIEEDKAVVGTGHNRRTAVIHAK
ncbi:unnamed protein product, partial [Didymodactylos carnosus]